MANPVADATVTIIPVRLAPRQNEEQRVAEERVILLFTKDVTVSLRKVDRAIVRNAAHTHVHPMLVDEKLTHEGLTINRIAEAILPICQEGDITMIFGVDEIRRGRTTAFLHRGGAS